jgi:O-antigen/teichoic acid export membrane protein
MPLAVTMDQAALKAAMKTPLGRIAQMGAAFAMSNVARGAIAFVMSLVIARGLGQDGFGRWIFCAAWAATLTTGLDLGFGVLLTRDAARDQRVCALLSRALVARLGLFIPVAAIFYVAAPLLGGQVATGTIRAVLPLAMTGVAYGCLAAVFRAWPERVLWILGLESSGALAQCCASWWLIREGGDVVTLLRAATFIQFTQLVVASLLLASVRVPEDRLEWPGRDAVLHAVRRALPFAAVGLIGTAQGRMAPLALGYSKGPAGVALFAVASRIASMARAVPFAALAGGLPVLSEHAGRGQMESVRPQLHRSLTAFAVAASLLLTAGASLLIRWTYGPSFSGAVPALVCIAVSLVPSLLNAGRRVYLYADQREHVVMRWSAVTLAVQAVACAVFIPLWGPFGAALGLMAGEWVAWWPLSRA